MSLCAIHKFNHVCTCNRINIVTIMSMCCVVNPQWRMIVGGHFRWGHLWAFTLFIMIIMSEHEFTLVMCLDVYL